MTFTGGGGGATTGALASGADGQAVIFYYQPAANNMLSLSRREDVVAGQGTFNWVGGAPSPQIVHDGRIGSSIRDPWYAVANIAGVAMQITEYVYDCDPDEIAKEIAMLTRR